jgi:hypothetical protein
MRVTIAGDPFAHLDQQKTLWGRGSWPARWVTHPEVGAGQRPVVVAYRREFRLAAEATVRLHVSADERYQLYVDGTMLGRGPERGDADNWFFETYEVALAAGRHVIVARVWSLGSGEPTEVGQKPGGQVGSPLAQISVYHGFLLACEDDSLSTGTSAWEAKVLPGYAFRPPGIAWGTGARVEVDGEVYAWNFQRGDGDGWVAVKNLHAGVGAGRMEAGPSHRLRPATLPAMIERYVAAGAVRHVEDLARPGADETAGRRVEGARNLEREQAAYQARWANRQPMRFPARTRRRVVVDLEDYYCAYPLVVTSGGKGGVVRLDWAEALTETADPAERRKGDRGEIEGKFFVGVGDVFRPDGGAGREFETPWWAAGRYLELFVETADEPLDVNVILRETRYPLEMSATFESSDDRLGQTIPILLRGLQVCSHETYVDCPYFEQLQYVGDARLEALITYAVSGDDRLARKAIELFDSSRLSSGLTVSRYPSRVRQVIPPFSLAWVGMVHDFAMWRDDAAFVRARMAGVRAVVDAFCAFRGDDGLVEGPAADWNFVDWAVGWRNGVPPGAEAGASAVVNWMFVGALRMARELEEAFGEPELAARCARVAREVTAAIDAAFWEPVRGLYADDRDRRRFSEHAQCLAILSGALPPARLVQVASGLLLGDSELARTTIYFTHYLFEAFRTLADSSPPLAADPMAVMFDRLGLWFELKGRGFVTPFEEPEPTRSDCHAWGSHPLFHYVATLAGVRPASFGFGTVDVRPRLGPHEHFRAGVPHPRGSIEVEAWRDGREARSRVNLPDGVRAAVR